MGPLMAEYSISQLSKEFEITTRTIRHYEDLGLNFAEVIRYIKQAQATIQFYENAATPTGRVKW